MARVIALSLFAAAFGAQGDDAQRRAKDAAEGRTQVVAHHGPRGSIPGEAPLPPYLHAVELTDAQEDQIFSLVHSQAPGVREKARAASKAMAELHELSLSEQFDPTKARELADAHARALADIALMRAEMDAKIRTLLTAEQIKSIANDEFRGEGKCRNGDAARPGSGSPLGDAGGPF